MPTSRRRRRLVAKLGCDVHLKVEVRDSSGVWNNVPFVDDWDIEHHKRPVPEGGIILKRLDDRNYNMFAVLADVRNGTWSDKIPPISQPRGLPEEHADYDDNSYGFGDHSFSWLTLRELQDYDWNQTITNRGYVSDAQVAELKGGKKPTSYAGWSSSGQQVTWVDTVGGMVGEDVFEDLNTLAKLAANPDDVRLVFGFDS